MCPVAVTSARTQSAVMDCTVCYSGLYGLHRKTIEDNRNKDLSCMDKKAYVYC